VHLLRIPRDLSGQRSRAVVRTAPASSLAVREIRVVTFDFGNTLVPVDRVGLGRVVELTAGWAVARLGASDVPTFLRVWAEERDRQFREEIPRFREADLAVRVVRVLARLRGGPAPAADTPWDDDAAVWWSDPAEVEAAVERYSRAFVEGLPPRPGIEPLLARLAVDRKLGILSNWPFAATIDRYALAAGWAPHLSAIVVSQRVGAIRPAPAIFDAALQALGNPEAAACLHVETTGRPTSSAPSARAGKRPTFGCARRIHPCRRVPRTVRSTRTSRSTRSTRSKGRCTTRRGMERQYGIRPSDDWLGLVHAGTASPERRGPSGHGGPDGDDDAGA